MLLVLLNGMLNRTNESVLVGVKENEDGSLVPMYTNPENLDELIKSYSENGALMTEDEFFRSLV